MEFIFTLKYFGTAIACNIAGKVVSAFRYVATPAIINQRSNTAEFAGKMVELCAVSDRWRDICLIISNFRRLISGALLLSAAATLVLLPGMASSQAVYRNIVNQKFRTVGNGPQSALIVDVAGDSDAVAVNEAVAKSYAAMRKSRDPIMLRELAAMRKNHEIKPGRQLDVVDFAIIRRDGKLAPAPPRTRAGNSGLTFSFPTDGAANSWSVAKAAQLSGLVNGLIPELSTVLGRPAWTGNVKVLNKDPFLGTVNEIFGALFVMDTASSTYQIWFPSFTDSQTEFLAMAQTMAQAWHGPDMIGYDAWEKGMARAVAIIAAQDLKSYPGLSGTTIDPSNGFYYTPDYDILNQPPLGNNTFMPPTKGAQTGPTINATQFGGMVIPRLQMSGSAWLKCYIENPSFFVNFNNAYYTAFTSDATVANDVNRLRTIAAAALPSIEGQPFDKWFEQQYVLDTSITVGSKLYAHTSATFPDSVSPAGAAVFLIYYLTTSTGDEQDLNGTSQVVYWDYTFTNRFSFPTFETVVIADGFGSVAPFFTGLGGNPANQMRIAMDFPVNKDYVRVFFPTALTGTDAAPNTFSGVLTGQDSGTISATFNSGGSINTLTGTVAQGAFGIAGTVGKGFSRSTITISQAGTTTLTFKRNLFIDSGNVTPIFKFAALGTSSTVMHSFSNGTQMISLPIRPFVSDLAKAIGADPARALMAQFREDNTIGSDQYLRYPQLPAYEPGYGLWTNFAGIVSKADGITGTPYDPISQPNVSIGLQFGWNQIGPPYNQQMNILQDVQFQYLGGTPAGYADAIANGWIAAGVIGYNPNLGYEDITNPTDITVFPTNQLLPWTGYWIRTAVTEGVTMTFLSTQSRAARPTRATTVAKPSAGSWRLPIQLIDSSGKQSTANVGQSSRASDTFKLGIDVSAPPEAPGAGILSLRLPAKQGDPVTRGAPGTLITDIRPGNGKVQWDMAATLPAGKQSFTISWGNTALLPHGTRLTLVDVTTGTHHTMNAASAYTFQSGANETTRLFQIISEPKSIGRLRISNVIATPAGGGGRAVTSMSISYEMSGPGQTTAEVRLNGRVVRRLSQASRAVESGVNQLVWDMRDDQGRGVTGGTYTLTITAQTAEGEQTRSIVPINVVR